MTDFFSLNKKVKKHDSETGLGSFLTITKLMGKKKENETRGTSNLEETKEKGLTEGWGFRPPV